MEAVVERRYRRVVGASWREVRNGIGQCSPGENTKERRAGLENKEGKWNRKTKFEWRIS